LFHVSNSALFRLYVVGVGALGIFLVLWSLWLLPTYLPLPLFGLLILLSIVATQATETVSVGKNAGITYHIGSAIGLASVPHFGVFAAIFLAAVDMLTLWLVKPRHAVTWKKTPAQLAFNVGNLSIATAIAGATLAMMRDWLGEGTLIGQTVPWIVAALVLDQVNLWLLIVVLRLQNKESTSIWSLWRENWLPTQISLVVLMFGSGILFYAIDKYDWQGVIIFFLPTVLSAYAFRYYVRGIKEQMETLETAVDERTRQLKEVNQRKDAFLAVLTHDMMTPLNSIQLCAEELLEDPMSAVHNPILPQVIMRSQKTLYNLVRNIIDLEKLRSGHRIQIQRTTCDLVQILSGVIDIVQPEVQLKHMKLEFSSTQTPFWFDVDRQQMERIMLNLVSNAVKYTSSGGAVSVNLDNNHSHAIITVHDTGYGIPAQELPYIFERFHRIEKSKNKAFGTGLGLAITKALVEEHGGGIAVESIEGKGSVFTVSLPFS
jgi:signal transduction histidine kinase